MDPNGDGMVDNPTDPDNDGIANNGNLDEKPVSFGGLSQNVGLPDLTPLIFSSASTYTQNSQQDVVITIFNVGNAPTAGPVTFEMSKITPALAVNSAATSSTVSGHTTVNNTEWAFDDQTSRYLVTLNNGLSIPANSSKSIVIQVSATGSTKAQANVTARIFTGTGGETPNTNNTYTYLISID